MSELAPGKLTSIEESNFVERILALEELSADKVSSASAALSRKIGRGRVCPLRELGPEASLLIRLPSSESCNWTDAIEVMLPHGSIEIADGARILRALTGIDLGDTQKKKTASSQWIESAIIGRLKNSPFRDVTGLESSASSDNVGAVTVQLVIRSKSHAIVSYARAQPQVWLALIANQDFIRERPYFRDFLHLPVNIPVRLARHSLPASMLQELKAGDLILPGNALFDCGGAGFLDISGTRFRVQYRSPSNLEIIAKEEKMSTWDESDQAMERGYDEQQGNHEGVEPDYQNAGPNIGTLPIPLEFELGRITLTFEELQSIGPGTILEVFDGAPLSIAIRSSGHPLGRGEIVEVDGNLGIRIAHWDQTSC